MRASIGILKHNIALIEGYIGRRPAEDPFRILRRNIDAAMGTRLAEVVVPEGGMDGHTGLIEKRGPGNGRGIEARPSGAARHVNRERLAPRGLITQRSEPLRHLIAVGIIERAARDAAEINLGIAFKTLQVLMLDGDIHFDDFLGRVNIRVDR